MNILFASIEQHKLRLENHSFCRILGKADGKDNRIFNFIPHMAFFVLGVRDMLESIRTPQAHNFAEEMVNLYCEKNSAHWQWFLQDIENMGLIAQGNKTTQNVIASIWAQDDFVVRNQVYRIMLHANQCQTAQEHLILIECLGAAFAAFIVNFNILTKRTGLYAQLKYFGKQHVDKESTSIVGNWLDISSAKRRCIHHDIKPHREDYIAQMVDDIFAGFNVMFSRWEQSTHESGKFISHSFSIPIKTAY